MLLPNGVVVAEVHEQSIGSSLPGCLCRAWNLADPFKHIDRTIRILCWLGNKAKRMVAPPVFPFLFQTVEDDLVGLLFIEFLIHS